MFFFFFSTLQRHCLGAVANLASVHSFSEYTFLQQLVSSGSNRHPVTWIGGFDAVQVSIGFMYVPWAVGCMHTDSCFLDIKLYSLSGLDVVLERWVLV